MQNDMGEGQPSFENTISQPPSEMTESQDGAPEEGMKAEGMGISQNRELEERKPSLGSSCVNSSDPSAETLLLASKVNEAKLGSEELRLNVVPKKLR